MKITMKMKRSTIDNLDWIKENTEENNRTRIMGVGVKLLRKAIEATKKGGRIVIENADGSKDGIKIIGL